MESGAITARHGLKKWLRRIGFGGFLFFLIKGLAWLMIGYFVIR